MDQVSPRYWVYIFFQQRLEGDVKDIPKWDIYQALQWADGAWWKLLGHCDPPWSNIGTRFFPVWNGGGCSVPTHLCWAIACRVDFLYNGWLESAILLLARPKLVSCKYHSMGMCRGNITIYQDQLGRLIYESMGSHQMIPAFWAHVFQARYRDKWNPWNYSWLWLQSFKSQF